MWGWFLVNDALLPSIKIWYAFGVPSKKKIFFYSVLFSELVFGFDLKRIFLQKMT
jgi:hypothetical protein